MLQIYKKLLFDLDNTLVDDNENRKYAINKVLIEKNGNATDEELENFLELDNQFWKDRASGKIKNPYEFKTDEEKTEWVRAQRFIKYFGDITFQEAVEMNSKYINYLKESIIPIKDATEILRYLNEKGYELYIITNSPTKIVSDKLDRINAQQYIKYAFSAEEAGHMKPHDRFFEVFFNRLGNYNKNEMLIIGDELDKDILGGIKCGIDTCWFNPNKLINNQYKTNYEIRELSELKNIL